MPMGENDFAYNNTAMTAAQKTHAAERLPSWEEIPAALHGNISGSYHPPVGIRQVEEWRELGKS